MARLIKRFGFSNFFRNCSPILEALKYTKYFQIGYLERRVKIRVENKEKLSKASYLHMKVKEQSTITLRIDSDIIV